METKLTYEECRRQRLEENKKRMEELNLIKLAQEFKASSPKFTPVREFSYNLKISLFIFLWKKKKKSFCVLLCVEVLFWVFEAKMNGSSGVTGEEGEAQKSVSCGTFFSASEKVLPVLR